EIHPDTTASGYRALAQLFSRLTGDYRKAFAADHVSVGAGNRKPASSDCRIKAGRGAYTPRSLTVSSGGPCWSLFRVPTICETDNGETTMKAILAWTFAVALAIGGGA